MIENLFINFFYENKLFLYELFLDIESVVKKVFERDLKRFNLFSMVEVMFEIDERN